MKSLIDHIKANPNINYLRMSDNWQENELPDEVELLTNLQRLHLDKPGLTRISPNIGKLTRLTALYISQEANISVPDTIAHCTQLQNITIYSDLANWDFLALLPNLESLVINQTNLETLPDSIRHLKNLKTLNLIGNKLTSLPSFVKEMEHLSFLELSDNQLTDIDFGPNNQSIEQLRIANNQLQTIPESIALLKNLKTLYLYGNKIERLPAALNQLHQLESLNINKNKMQSLPSDMSGLQNLKYIQFEPKWVADFPLALIQLPRLIKIPKYSKANPNYQYIPTLAKEVNKKKLSLDFGQFLLDMLAQRFDKLKNHPQYRLYLCESLNVSLPALHVVAFELLAQLHSQPIGPNSNITVVGTLPLTLTALKERLKKLNIAYAPKINPKTTHVVVSKNPKANAALAANSPAQLLPPAALMDFLNAADTPYLLEASAPEDNSQNLSAMLLSGDASSIGVAVQIIQGGGLAPELLTDLLIVFFNSRDQKLRAPIRKILEQYGPQALLPAYSKTNAPERNIFQFTDIHKFEKNFDKFVAAYQLDPLKILKYLTIQRPPNTYGHNILLSKFMPYLSVSEARQAIYNIIDGDKLDLSQFNIERLDPLIFASPDIIHKTATLDIHYAGLKKLPDFVANFSTLFSLNIANNKLTELPDFVGQFNHLQYLNISYNNFKTVPSRIEQLTSLQNLSLSCKNLSQLPAWIEKLPLLRSLQVNEIEEDTIPDFIYRLTGLDYLYLYHGYRQSKKYTQADKDKLSAALPDTTIYLR